jgi:hypothetical protein
MNVIGSDPVYVDADDYLILGSIVFPFEALRMCGVGRCMVSSEDAVVDIDGRVVEYGQ